MVGKYLFMPILFVTLPQEPKRFEIMNTAVRTIQDTPMAPYAGMMKSMEPSDMQAVILFLQDAMREAEETERKADDEFLAKKLAEIKIDPDIDELVDWLRLTPEEAADERTRWILGLDRK